MSPFNSRSRSRCCTTAGCWRMARRRPSARTPRWPRFTWGSSKESREMLEVRDIHTYYGDSYVLQGVSLKADRGTVVAVLGRNGVGKTTLIRSIIGFAPPRPGQLWFKSGAIPGMPPDQIAQMEMGATP